MHLSRIKYLLTATVIIAVLLGGCATTQPIPEVSQPQSAALAIAVTLIAPIGIVSNKPDQIYFAKIVGEDGLLQQQIIRSNYIKDGRAYLLNARPGTYVAVGAFFLQPMQVSRSVYRVYFARELVERSKVIVRDGDFVFMGNYVVDTSTGLDGADDVQAHYKNVIAPGAATGLLAMSFSGDVHYRGTLRECKADEETHNAFIQKAKEDLGASGWAARIK